MKVSVMNMIGQEVGAVELPSAVFEAKVNRDLMHQALVRQLANARRGTHKAKSRSEVSFTTAKWYRQKGTGRARHGSKSAPILVGGGVAHGPKPRSYVKDMPRKMRQTALRSALSVKAGGGNIVILDKLEMKQIKTKDMAETLDVLCGARSTLLLLAESDRNVELSARNIPEVKTLRASYLNIRDLLGHHKVIIPLDALDLIQGYLGEGQDLIIDVDLTSPVVDEEE
ncbi:MAG: 50S ribosomal protein L4 [Anaerolineae bacterium]|nr:MAG: 50S ribosomal protein L4 [Anaerolineae bacterium]